ncbi:MAG: UDP-N-acetylmuramate dehydrogenase [Bacteroidia bacterium]
MSGSACAKVSLANYHSFGLRVYAERLLFPQSEAEVQTLAEQATYVIGEGSNILPTGNCPALLTTRGLLGFQLLRESRTEVEVEVAAGENWDGWVRYTLYRGWYGLENLAAIPGSVGAAAVQNIGAYGVELAPFLISVYGWHKERKAWLTLPVEACALGYRTSIFQTPEWRDRFIITRLRLRLRRRFVPVLDYPDVAARLNPEKQHDPWHLYQTVRQIRSEKLPSKGNAGSFFKNPILSYAELERLRQKAPDAPAFPYDAERYKVPAAWLIDRLGLKGYRIGGAMVHPRQPLVLVNTGTATPEEVLALAAYVQARVQETWGISLEPEVRLL